MAAAARGGGCGSTAHTNAMRVSHDREPPFDAWHAQFPYMNFRKCLHK